MCDIMKPIATFAARSLDDNILSSSTSGGVFVALANVILSQKGVVVGAAWAKDMMSVVHKCVETEADIGSLQGSKYTQSSLANVISDIDVALSQERMVLFTGTPCQIAAMHKRYMDAPNLILCAVICHSNSSPEFWRKYAGELQTLKNDRIKNVRFRDKRHGWRNSYLSIEFQRDERNNIFEPLGESPYIQAYFEGYISKDACLKCQFKGGRCNADIIIGDFWGIEDCCKRFDDGKGVSVVFAYSAKGLALLESADLDKENVEYRKAIGKNPYHENSISPNMQRRARFLKAYVRSDFRKAIMYANREKLSIRIVYVLVRIWNRFKGCFANMIVKSKNRDHLQ